MDIDVNRYAKIEKIPYYTTKMSKTANNIEQLANMSDTQIMLSSMAKSEQDAKKSLAGRLSKVITPATIGAFILTDMAKAKVKDGDVIKKAPPSMKLLVGAASLASWLGVFKSYDIANKASNKLADKTDNENLKAGILLTGTIGGAAGIYLGARELITRGVKKFAESMPETMGELSKKAAKFDENVRANEIIKTLKKNVAEPVSKFAAKHGKLSKFVSKNSFPLIFGLSVLGSFLIGNKISKIRNGSFEENANKLYQTREEARVATAKLEASKADYDSKIKDDGFVVNTKEIIKTADANPNNIDKAIEETIAKALK